MALEINQASTLSRLPRLPGASELLAAVVVTKIAVPVGSVTVVTTDPSALVNLELLASVVLTEITLWAASMTVVTTDPSGWVMTLLVLPNGDVSVEAPLGDAVLDPACKDIGATTLAELGKIEPMLSLMRVSLSVSAWKSDMGGLVEI